MARQFRRLVAGQNEWLLTVFLTYVCIMFLFALIYFMLYKQDRRNFSYNADILKAQKSAVANSTASRLARASEALSVLDELLRSDQANWGTISPGPPPAPMMSIRIGDSKYCLDARAAILSGSEAVGSTLTVERFDGTVIKIEHGPVVPFPQNRDGILSLCALWRSRLSQQIDELNRIRAALDFDSSDVWTFPDFFYFSAITQATVGYGDILPNSTPVRIVVTLQTIFSLTLVIVLVNWVVKGRRSAANRHTERRDGG
jgi:hypothetical protein